MKVIGFDTSALDPGFKAHAGRGIGRYVAELAHFFEREFSSRSASSSMKFDVASFDHRSLERHGGLGVRAATAVLKASPILRTTLKQQVLFPFQLSRAEGSSFTDNASVVMDAVHFPAQMDAPAWGLRRYALTVLDLIPLVCADLYRAKRSGIRFKFARWLELQAIRNASLVLCISAHTARDVHELLGVPWERLIVTPLGVDEKFFAASTPREALALRSKYGLSGIQEKRPLVLYVGGIDPRKNVGVMVRAFAETLQHFRAKPGTPQPLLFMAGRIQDDREFPELERTIRSLGLENDVIMPGFVPDEDLLLLYSAARVFFFPSLYEGFGLPPLEAMAAGLPVVSSDTSAMPEVLGDSAVFFPPTDYQAAAQALVTVLSDSERAEKLRHEGRERARLFTWQKTGEATLRAYERLLTEHPEAAAAPASARKRVF